MVEIVFETMGTIPEAVPQERFERSKEYWIGWAVAYYQWHSSRKYSEIFKAFSFGSVSCGALVRENM